MGFPVNLSVTLGSSLPALGPSFNTTVADDWFGVKVTSLLYAGAGESDVAIFRLDCLDAGRSHRYVVNTELARFIGCGTGSHRAILWIPQVRTACKCTLVRL